MQICVYSENTKDPELQNTLKCAFNKIVKSYVKVNSALYYVTINSIISESDYDIIANVLAMEAKTSKFKVQIISEGDIIAHFTVKAM